MPNLPRFLAHFSQNYKIFAKNLRFRIRRVVLERVDMFLSICLLLGDMYHVTESSATAKYVNSLFKYLLDRYSLSNF